MMTWIFAGIIVISTVFGILTGRIDLVSQAAIDEGTKAVELALTLMGAMCLWSGIMAVAEKAKLTEKLSRLLAPILRLLFKGMKTDSPEAKAISMNIGANLLGLGNAATPLGIAAMKELQKKNKNPKVASDHMITFVVLNTASIQLIPTTTALLRLRAGSAAPMEILPAVWFASIVSVASGIIMTLILSKRRQK